MNKRTLQCNSEDFNSDPSKLLVSLPVAGKLLSISSRTVRRLSQLGELPSIVKVGGSARISYQGIIDYHNRLTGLEG